MRRLTSGTARRVSLLGGAGGEATGGRIVCAPFMSMMPTPAKTRMTWYVGSISNQRAAKFGLMPNLWWLFWKSSPAVTKSKTSVFRDLSPLSKFL